MRATSRLPLALAIGATGTSLCLAVLAGLQRGATLSERVAWVAIGVVLVVSAHLLPALVRGEPPVVRATGTLLWFACMTTAGYGHVTFFVLAQQHAGERRAAAVVVPSSARVRSLTVVMAERTTLTRQLAWIDLAHCSRDCTKLDARRRPLAARLDALNAEADDVGRIEGERDRARAQRDALLGDPVTARLAALLGVTAARVDLQSGLAFAAVLEGVACLLWVVALRPSRLPVVVPAVTDAAPVTTAPVVDAPDATPPVATGVTASHVGAAVSHDAATGRRAIVARDRPHRDDPVTPLPDGAPPGAAGGELVQLARAVAAGHVRPTVADIRRHLGCSQARASALRRQLAGRNATA
ncbi:hypothetical protein [Paraburkholderia terricola]|jgi:hypothetical protein|uniref:hypothetical protein n=1 Tax=Paraburkholderia terricola TaxID=169427 RepID=UPI000DEF8DD3|nr:hypothetical protein [Paraburkholderia terricola]AXE91063.1 hypothetical protein CUJ90_00860 [Paraburkholderia terricola]